MQRDDAMMRRLEVTFSDYRRLVSLIKVAGEHNRICPFMALLYPRLLRAKLSNVADVAGRVIAMDDLVLVQSVRTADPSLLQIVYPDAPADLPGVTNVFTSAGVALLGRSTGDTVCWKTGDGIALFQIKDVIPLGGM